PVTGRLAAVRTAAARVGAGTATAAPTGVGATARAVPGVPAIPVVGIAGESVLGVPGRLPHLVDAVANPGGRIGDLGRLFPDLDPEVPGVAKAAHVLDLGQRGASGDHAVDEVDDRVVQALERFDEPQDRRHD